MVSNIGPPFGDQRVRNVSPPRARVSTTAPCAAADAERMWSGATATHLRGVMRQRHGRWCRASGRTKMPPPLHAHSTSTGGAMSFEGFPGRDVRAKLDHPVIDADAHVVECDFAHLDFVRQIAGEDTVKRIIAERANHG